ncbi:MAG: DUF6088 family protein [Waddliaceae bacterium]
MSISENIRRKIDSSGERFWRYEDFKDMSLTGVAQALSRLYKQGKILRLGKGLYYKPRETPFGLSKPNTNQLQSLGLHDKNIYPSGLLAANHLGFSTQNPAKIEVSTSGLSLPRTFIGQDAIVHTRRPMSWQKLTQTDAAILEFLRARGESSELSPKKTVARLIQLFKEPNQFDRLFKVAKTEPPRVRAIMGAIGQEIGIQKEKLLTLRKSLNPLSRFDFGTLFALKYAREWQAKEHKRP